MIALLHDRGGFALVLSVIAGCAGIVVVTVYGFAAPRPHGRDPLARGGTAGGCEGQSGFGP